MIALSENLTYRFEGLEVDLSRSCLRRSGSTEEIHLRRKTFQVLVYLIERRERVVTKDELMGAIWKDTAVTDDALVQSIKEIRRALGDSSNNSRFIKTVPKMGYRFVSPIELPFEAVNQLIRTEEITQVEIEIEEETDDFNPLLLSEEQSSNALAPAVISAPNSLNRWLTPGTAQNNRSRRLALAALIIVVASGALIFYFGQNRSKTADDKSFSTPIAGKKTITVAYFENRSGDAEIDWLREGLTDMLIANLSRSAKLNVLSRARLQALVERIKSGNGDQLQFEDALEIARRTQAETFITGSFVRIENKMRVDAQIHDTQTGNLLASETLTVEKPEQILTEIDLLSLKLLNRLNAAAKPEETSNLSSVMTDNLEAYRYYSLAVEKAQALHNQEAIELLQKSVALDPNFAMAYARIGYAYAVTWNQIEAGKPFLEKAFRLSNRLTEKDRLNIAAWYAIANLDYPSAIDSYREIISKYPLETEAYYRLSRLLAGEEKLEEAVTVLRQGLIIDPESKTLYNVLGGTLSLLNRYDEAIAAHLRYVELDPNEPNTYDSLAASYQASGNYDEAIKNYNHALELKPDFDIALVHLANARFQLGQYGEAIQLYRRYIDAAPSNMERSRGLNSIAAVYRAKGDFKTAEKVANEAIKANPEAVRELFIIALKNGNSKTAQQLEKQSLSPGNDNDRGARAKQRLYFYLIGLISLTKNHHDEAITKFQETLRHSPANWNIENFEDCLANAYLEIDKIDEAIAEYERILRINPNYPLARFHLAEAFKRKNLTAEARENYQQFLQIWKDADADIPEVITARNFIENS